MGFDIITFHTQNITITRIKVNPESVFVCETSKELLRSMQQPITNII